MARTPWDQHLKVRVSKTRYQNCYKFILVHLASHPSLHTDLTPDTSAGAAHASVVQRKVFCFEEQLERPCLTCHRRTCCCFTLASVHSPGVTCLSSSGRQTVSVEEARQSPCLWRGWLQGLFCCMRSLQGNRQAMSSWRTPPSKIQPEPQGVCLWLTKVLFFLAEKVKIVLLPCSLPLDGSTTRPPNQFIILLRWGFFSFLGNFPCQVLEGETWSLQITFPFSCCKWECSKDVLYESSFFFFFFKWKK